MLRLASLMRSAISRRTPMTLISVVSGAGAGRLPAAAHRTAWAPDAAAAGRAPAAIKSSRTMRPPGPEPATLVKIDAGLARAPPIGRRGHDPPPGRSAAGAAGAAPAHGGTCGRRRAAARLRRGATGRGRCAGGSGRRRRRSGGVGLEHDQRRTDRHLVARRTGDREHSSADRRRHLDGRLVGHHLDDDLILGDHCARVRCARRRFPPRRCPRPGPAS